MRTITVRMAAASCVLVLFVVVVTGSLEEV
jgi:hypothetical protein